MTLSRSRRERKCSTPLLLALIAAGVAITAPARAQGPPEIKLEGVASVDRAAAGSKFEAAVVMEIPALGSTLPSDWAGLMAVIVGWLVSDVFAVVKL